MPNATITAGGTPQNVVVGNPGRRGIIAIRNNSAETLWLDIDSNAGIDDGMPLLTNEYWEAPGSVRSRLSIVGATTGSKYWYGVFER